jgi:hypothetical protein
VEQRLHRPQALSEGHHRMRKIGTLFTLITVTLSLLGLSPASVQPASASLSPDSTNPDDLQPPALAPVESVDDSFNADAAFLLAPDTPLDPQMPAAADVFGYSVSTQALQLTPDETIPFWVDANWPLTRMVSFTLPVLDNALSVPITIGPDQSTPGLETPVGSDIVRHPFRYYDAAYNTVYISMNGVVRFANTIDSDFRNYPLPTGDITPAAPLAFMAPFWADLDANVPQNQVYYNNALPETSVYVTYLGNINPYNGSYSAFVITWDNVCWRKSDEAPFTSTDQFSFQVVFKDNGDIFVNLLSLPSPMIKATIGIQDADGADGLMYYYNGYKDPDSAAISSMLSIKFTRPAPDYRMRVFPRLLGSLVSGGRAAYSFNVKNISEVTGTVQNTDIYDFVVSPPAGWTVKFFNKDLKPLLDSNLNGRPDTGPVGLNEIFTVYVLVQAPAETAPGVKRDITVNVQSFRSSLQRSAILQAVVPTAYALTNSDGTGTYLDLVWKHSQYDARVAGFSGDMLAVENTIDGFTYAWSEYNPLKLKNYVHFGFIDRLGFLKFDSIFDHLGAANDTFPALAANYDSGLVALVWLREAGSNYQVWFSLLYAGDPDGIVRGPILLDSQPLASYALSSPVVALQRDGSGDFTVAWVEQNKVANTTQIKARVVDDATGSLSAIGSLLPTPATGEIYGLTFESLVNPPQVKQTILFYVDTSSGNAELRYLRLFDTTRLEGPVLVDTSVSLNQRVVSSDLIKDNNILIAWLDPNISVGPYSLQGVSFAVMNASTRVITHNSAMEIANPNLTNAAYISVAADNNGNPVLVWTDADAYRYVFYAYLNPSGTFITTPTLIQTLPSGTNISLSGNGQGLAAYDGRYMVELPLIRK